MYFNRVSPPLPLPEAQGICSLMLTVRPWKRSGRKKKKNLAEVCPSPQAPGARSLEGLTLGAVHAAPPALHQQSPGFSAPARGCCTEKSLLSAFACQSLQCRGSSLSCGLSPLTDLRGVVDLSLCSAFLLTRAVWQRPSFFHARPETRSLILSI